MNFIKDFIKLLFFRVEVDKDSNLHNVAATCPELTKLTEFHLIGPFGSEVPQFFISGKVQKRHQNETQEILL